MKWNLSKSHTFSNRTNVESNGKKIFVIEHSDSDYVTKEEIELHEKLVSAAPDLLDALKDFCENLELQLNLRGCQTESAPLKSDADSHGGLQLLSCAKALISQIES